LMVILRRFSKDPRHDSARDYPMLPHDQSGAERNIRIGRVTGVFQAVLILGSNRVVVGSGETRLLVATAQLVVHVLLTFGVYCGSHMAAVAVMLWFLVSCLIQLLLSGFSPWGLILNGAYLTGYALDVTGTVAWHRSSRRHPPSLRPVRHRYSGTRRGRSRAARATESCETMKPRHLPHLIPYQIKQGGRARHEPCDVNPRKLPARCPLQS
jgi:hypothetical protein